MARYSRYEEVARLDEVEKESLLKEGDPPERVWAAWALGVRRGAGFMPDLATTLAVEPSAGARRHLAIVLGGYGERWLLTVLATGDPDPGVRETACRALARLATTTVADDEVFETLLGRLLNDVPTVRAAVVESLPACAPEVLRRAADATLTDPALEVREAAFARIAARVTSGEPLPASVPSRALVEPERFLRRKLLALWESVAGPRPLLAGAAARSPEVLLQALDLLLEEGRPVAWSAVESVSQSALSVATARLLRLFAGRLDEIPLGPRLAMLLVLEVEPSASDPALRALEEALVENVRLDLARSVRDALPEDELALAGKLRTVLEGRYTSWDPVTSSTSPLPAPVDPRTASTLVEADEEPGLWGLLAILRRVK